MMNDPRDWIDYEYGTNAYDEFRMAMFGDDSLEHYKDLLDDKEGFIEWALNEGEIIQSMKQCFMADVSEKKARMILSDVFDYEVQKYLSDMEEY